LPFARQKRIVAADTPRYFDACGVASVFRSSLVLPPSLSRFAVLPFFACVLVIDAP